MTDQSFVDRHPLREAFLGNRLLRLVDLIVEQGNEVLLEVDLSLPSQTASTVLFIDENGKVSTADIARELRLAHQLATQRVNALMDKGLLERKSDPLDKRRKILLLTKKGKQEAKRLKKCLEKAASAFEDLQREIDSELSKSVLRALKALKERPLADRIQGQRAVVDAGARREAIASKSYS